MYLRSVSVCLALAPRKKQKQIYRPISKLTFLSKLLEKVVSEKDTTVSDASNLHDTYQSGFRNTETALVKITNDILMAADDGKCTLMVLRDPSFEDVDHGVLVNRLNHYDIWLCIRLFQIQSYR